MNKQVKSAVRVLDVLELLSARAEPMRLLELAVTLGIPKSSAHGLLSTLQGRGYVTKDTTDRYAINEMFRQGFAWVGGLETLLRSIAMPIVENLRDRLGETVFVCMRNEYQDARLVCKAVSRHPIRYDSSDDVVLPGYATVMGRVLLAFQAPEKVDAYFARTELTPFTDQSLNTEAQIRAELAKIREDGYGVIIDQFAQGGAGIAAPVRNADGKVVAVIDMATVTARYEARRDEMLAGVLEGAAQISARLGYRPELTKSAGDNAMTDHKGRE